MLGWLLRYGVYFAVPVDAQEKIRIFSTLPLIALEQRRRPRA